MPQQDELPSCEVVILTALGLECQAVLAHLQDIQETVHPQREGSYHSVCAARRFSQFCDTIECIIL